VASTGFLPSKPRFTKDRDTVSSSSVAVAPEEVLFRRKGAPKRYAENDIYWADRSLTDDQRLPDSDLLKAIHTYASDFYQRATKNKGAIDFESLDETALLCFGILLEETARHVLGDTGDLAFVEGEEIDETDDDADSEDSDPESLTSEDEMSSTSSSAQTTDSGSESEEDHRRKKRKIEHESSDDG